MHAPKMSYPTARTPRRLAPRRRGVSMLVAGALSTLGLAPLTALPAAAQPLAEAGPVDILHGYPMWFADAGLAGDPDVAPVRLELCLDQVDPFCQLVDPLPDATQPASVPENFAEEAFWWPARRPSTPPQAPAPCW